MPAKLTTEEFIRRSTELYGSKYDYSKVDYQTQGHKVCIICPVHGEFYSWPSNFLRGHDCPACNGRERITLDVFIKRAAKKHNNRYDYSKVEYRGLSVPVSIICPVHGVFHQKPMYHLNGNGCPICYGTPKSNTEEFINKAKTVYGETYDYSKVDYKGNKEKICIICPEHGEWWVTPNNFLRGSRCPGCFGTPKHTTEEFIQAAKKVHGDKYDYSKVEYDGNKKKVIIICPIHGEFKQDPYSHARGSGCPECYSFYIRKRIVPVKKPVKIKAKKAVPAKDSVKIKDKRIATGEQAVKIEKIVVNRHNGRITRKAFIEKSINNHKIQYDYSKTEFERTTEKVCIICPKHGEFWQNAGYHMRGGNCPKCVGGVRISREDFICKAMKVHEGKYDYSKVEYKNTSTKVCIICPDHGEFWQTPNNHLFGAGCPTCPQSNLEGEVREFLIKNGIEFYQEYSFKWLRHKKKLSLDFYLPAFEIAIECQGKQHFEPVGMFGGEEFYLKTVERDMIKKKLCEEHGIRVVYFSNAHIDYPYKVVETYNELIDVLKT